MILKNYSNCSTAELSLLDEQLIRQIQVISPTTLTRIDQIPGLLAGNACHPYLQTPAVNALRQAISERGQQMTVNSAYRTIAQQAILFQHFQNRQCGIKAAARPGASNHNTGLAIDIEDAVGWRPYLEKYGWDWIGSFDPMHFDYVRPGCKDLKSLSIKAFQQLWNLNNPKQKIAEDGVWGLQTYQALLATSCSGFPAVGAKRIPAVVVPAVLETHQLIPSLRKGDRNEYVLLLQQALNRKGYGLKVDGIFGTSTQIAVEALQQAQGLDIDGVVGVGTKRALGLA
ncbi:MAG: peptidoglycan-binding protein [Xenococcaceae cyanobacterium]